MLFRSGEWPVPGSAPGTGRPPIPVRAAAPPSFPAATGPQPVPAQPLPAPAADGGGRSARRQRVTTREIFCELADLASIPRSAYALETETDGTMCLLPTPEGFEVFIAADGARHEVRSFADEEAAYFYMFGVLAAEAVRNGSLAPAVGAASPRGGI